MGTRVMVISGGLLAMALLFLGPLAYSRYRTDLDRLRAELQEHVKARLSKHKYPRWVVFVDDLPKNDRGKVDKKFLVEREKQGENPWR